MVASFKGIGYGVVYAFKWVTDFWIYYYFANRPHPDTFITVFLIQLPLYTRPILHTHFCKCISEGAFAL